MLRHGEYSDIPLLKSLWYEAFGGEEAYTEDFYKRIFRPSCTLCEERAGEICAMLYKLPCSIYREAEGWTRAYYLYALATGKKYRSQGIMGSLVAAALKEMEAEGTDTVFLIPAGESLIEYYRKFGFEVMAESFIPGENLSVREGSVRFPAEIRDFCREWYLREAGNPAQETGEGVPVCIRSGQELKAVYGLIPM